VGAAEFLKLIFDGAATAKIPATTATCSASNKQLVAIGQA
jgi:hypothetical protein